MKEKIWTITGCALVVLPMLLIAWLPQLCEWLDAPLQLASSVGLWLLAPCAIAAIWRRARPSVAVMLSCIATCWIAWMWCDAVLVTANYWGPTGLFVGLLLAGIGALATGLAALLFHAQWAQLWQVSGWLLGAVALWGAAAWCNSGE